MTLEEFSKKVLEGYNFHKMVEDITAPLPAWMGEEQPKTPRCRRWLLMWKQRFIDAWRCLRGTHWAKDNNEDDY